MAPRPSGGSESVRVVVRCRPMNRKEKEDSRKQTVDFDPKTGTVLLHNPKADKSEAPKQFTFALVFDEHCKQVEVFDDVAMPLVRSAL